MNGTDAILRYQGNVCIKKTLSRATVLKTDFQCKSKISVRSISIKCIYNILEQNLCVLTFKFEKGGIKMMTIWEMFQV